MSASSMPHCCSGVAWPTRSPRRLTWTAPTCSTKMRVSSPSKSISGRNDAGLALRDIGATSTTERGRNSLAWTTTPKRRSRCSCPCPRGTRSSRMSPRSTQALHHCGNLEHLAPVGFVGFECCDFLGESSAPSQPGRALDDGSPDRFGSAHADCFELAQRTLGFVVKPQADGDAHASIVSRFVIQLQGRPFARPYSQDRLANVRDCGSNAQPADEVIDADRVRA